ncbi:hypothetical protein [Streptomyces sp. SAJ15]|uniref:hypothetical protein n=1 Tax=Streptomyces sp. SAJ15 TaxID=2011095 RepID=UPI0011849C74|nr:hypothetical protein [Streptomyces sp. SAJ15]TVL87822.1 hypothetical protein CD790_32580 [Streptomyces sp. SAJ15]
MTDIARHLAAIDELRARPFPDRPVSGPLLESGPGFHIADLRVSEDFWDADLARVAEVDEEFDAELRCLIQALSRRWGEPEAVDLTDHLERSALHEPVPPPLDSLCSYVGRLHAWRVDGRWVAVGVGQGDRELPIQLVAAIGEGDMR